MSSLITKAERHSTPADTTAAVDRFMDELEHPFKDEIQRLRACILAVDPSIAEGIKWKAPSFRTSEYFATTNLRAKGATGVILHLGAKVRDAPPGGVKIKDPDGLLKWLAGDRAMVEFKTGQDLEDHAESFQALIRQWIRYL